jgi:hypothetical protein
MRAHQARQWCWFRSNYQRGRLLQLQPQSLLFGEGNSPTLADRFSPKILFPFPFWSPTSPGIGEQVRVAQILFHFLLDLLLRHHFI